MFNTKNTLPESVRHNVIQILQVRLSDSIDLQLQTKQAHWNVKGPDFIALHKLFDRIHKVSRDFVDLVAERIIQLGGVAEGTKEAMANNSTLPEYPLNLVREEDHIEALSNSLAQYGKVIRECVDQVETLHDRTTSDILIEISRRVDKYLWFV